MASWKRRRTSDNDTIVENDAAKRSVDETVETTVNESCATGVTSSEYHQQEDDITNEFASSQVVFFLKRGRVNETRLITKGVGGETLFETITKSQRN